MPHSRALRYGNWLGLAAMCLLLLGPLLGQSLAQPAGDWQWLNELACASEHKAPQAQTSASDWVKCGYCTLLLSSPALASKAAALQTQAVGHTLLRPHDAPALTPAGVFPGARSRAPPSQA